ncbi:hypothetical protein Taro_026971 [Colocasia esculenta]|uniref:Ribosomal protein eL8/eL30/eS12/Gadd45 domain-containing protein n=1 Tax=Colocasia esculenta TaxID=4460 RepID=A0A843VSY0_COLES|nr:hypothetical protein [Colocasia esculenta]
MSVGSRLSAVARARREHGEEEGEEVPEASPHGARRRFAASSSRTTGEDRVLPGGSANRAVAEDWQAVLVASDCSPSYLTSHLPSLARSRGIPVIFVRDKRGGSLRLGELVKLKTAMVIGVKVRGTRINKAVEEVLGGMGLEDIKSLQT